MTAEIISVVFSAADSDQLDSLRKLPVDVQYGLRKFPHPKRYHDWVAAGQPGTAQPAFGSAARLAALAQRDWQVRGQNGCQFARLAALGADQLRWDYLVVPGTDVAGQTGAGIAALVGSAAADPGCEIVSLLFPDVTGCAEAVRISYGLTGQPGFWLERDDIEGARLHLHLRYTLPASPVTAWVMAFAPFDFMPNSRRGPFFELAIRIKPKPAEIFHRLNPDRAVAHLADAPLAMSDRRWEDRWRTTLRRTRMILGQEPDHITAAKSTLAPPLAELKGYTLPHDEQA